jgi:flavin-dependent dehydrogenase
MKNDFDVVIVGARCAGAATALLLARAGVRVLVVDRGAYGSDTLSTHALMRGAVLQLKRWDVLPALVSAGTPPVRSTTFGYATHQTVVAIEPRFGVDALYAPRRALLDRSLADAAMAAGATFMYRTSLEGVVKSATGRIIGVTLSGDDAPSRIDADLVIGADGLRSTVATRVGAACTAHGAHATAVLYSYWQGLHVDGYEWHYRDGLSLGAIPTNDAATCLFVSFPSRSFRSETREGASEAYLRLIQRMSTSLNAQIGDARRVEQVRGFVGYPGCVKQSSGPGWALVGDAGYFKDPLTAHGITDALRDAEFLARAVLIGTDQALADYEQARDDLSRGLFEVTDAIASFAWSVFDLEGLHRTLSKEMSREVKALAQLDASLTARPDPAAAAVQTSQRLRP